MTVKPVLVILGPTCSGKSSLAFAVARKTGGEIISADSRQIYRGMDIGTAKPSQEMLRTVRHHFIDEKNIGEEFTAGNFAAEAQERIRLIQDRERHAIVAGGSTLYLEGLLQGFDEMPRSDPAVRARLQEELEIDGVHVLYQRLQSIDPEQAATLDPTKTQRLIRSLEIIGISGQTVTSLQLTAGRKTSGITFLTFGLMLPREVLYERINRRTDDMMQAGLLQEARHLHEQYLPRIRAGKINALRTVGYQELFQYLDGNISLDQAVTLIRQHTRNYAKRQLTFFKNRLDVEWLDAALNEAGLMTLADKLSLVLTSAS
jgi:tRNA dimethylallyltransferase